MQEDKVKLGARPDLEGAIRSGSLASLAQLVRAGVDVNGRGPDGLTPLMIASGLGQPQMVDLLLSAGADVHVVEARAGAAALHKAALSGNPDAIDLLLKHGAFIDQQGPVLGHTALMDAVVYRHAAAVRLLLKRGARTSIRNHWNETALELAHRDGLHAIARLIEERNEADAAEIAALPLVSAIKSGNTAEVAQLIAAGSDVDARLPMVGRPDDDYTPLAIAAREGHVDIVRLLLEAGAEPRRVIGLFLGTALHEACYFGHTEVVGMMTGRHERAGVRAPELDAQGAYNGFTPLHDAVWQGHLQTARVLVAAGHPLDLRTHAGLTARELAALHGYHELETFLSHAEQSA